MTQINTRSPYFIYTNVTSMTSASIDIFIYTGTQTTDRPASAQYSLTQTAISEKVTFEISELVRDYIDITFNGTHESKMVWVDYELTTFIGASPTVNSIVALYAYDGYGDFENGVQNQSTDINSGAVMMTNTKLYKKDGEEIVIPIRNTSAVTATSYDSSGNALNTISYAGSTESSEVIKYFIDRVNSIDYQARVSADSGTFESTTCLTTFLATLNDATSVVIGTTTITIEPTCEYRYTPLKITFVNKFGALQDVWFFKKNTKSMKIEDSDYKANIITDGSFNTYSHQKRTLNKQGQTTMNLSSGFVIENYTSVFEELVLSELAWIEIDAQTLPITVTDSSFDYKTSVNDKLIEYKIKIEMAFDKINSVR